MDNKVKLTKIFSKKMLPIAILTGLLISISTPLTFFLLSWSREKAYADDVSKQITQLLTKYVKENPEYWIISPDKFVEVFSPIDTSVISQVRFYNADGQLTQRQTFSKESILYQSGYSNIVNNGIQFGHVEVDKKTDKVQLETGILFLIFLALGMGATFILYYFPTKNILKAETEINNNINTLSHLSYHDSLTGLTNRASMNELITNFISLHHKFTLLFLDLDNFKNINDSLGHSMGDSLLKIIGQHLQSVVRSTDIVARLGGDEFMIILREVKDREIAAGIAQHILDSFKTSIKLKDYDLTISTSIGITLYPDDGEDIEILVKNADIAMYEAKKQGKNRYYFSKGIDDNELINRLRLISYLHLALEKNEFRLYIQPKFDINTLETIGGEVLIRWFHPEIGLVLPGSFISLAEETGLIIPIGEWILKKSFQQIKDWSDNNNLGDMRFSINISPLQFLQNNLISFIKECLNATKVETKYLEFEITENIALQKSETILNKLLQIKELGIEISIDDFGTGYSSMSYLNKYPIDTLKIDVSFVKEITKNKENEAIVTAIIAMAHSLNLKVIAEGIETEEQLRILRKKKCDFGQGYLIGKPMDVDSFEGVIRGSHQNRLNMTSFRRTALP